MARQFVSHRLSFLVLAAFLLLPLMTSRLYSALQHNLAYVQIAKANGQPKVDFRLDRLVDNSSDHLFRYLIQSHLFAAKGEWEQAAEACDRALAQSQQHHVQAEFIPDLCQARHLAAAGNWDRAAHLLASAVTRMPRLITLLGGELSLVLGNRALDQWKETNDLASLCLAKYYFDTVDLESESRAIADVLEDDCPQTPIFGSLQVGDAQGCIALDPQHLEFPGYTSARLSMSDCEDEDSILSAPGIKFLNSVGSGGFVLSHEGEPALGVGRYYYNDAISYQKSSLIRLDKSSGRRYLSVAPKRGRRPDSLVPGHFAVLPDHTYLVGGIARKQIVVGCIWWGGGAHGSSSTIGITGQTWTLRAMLIEPPPGANQCVLIFYNSSQTTPADLDSIFLADLGSTSLHGVLHDDE